MTERENDEKGARLIDKQDEGVREGRELASALESAATRAIPRFFFLFRTTSIE